MPDPVEPDSGSPTASDVSAETGIYLISTIVLDPDAGTRGMLADALANRGHQVMTSDSFEETARALDEGGIDCLVFKLREAWVPTAESFLRYLRRSHGPRLPHMVAVVMDDPPARPVDWIGLGIDDCVVGASRGPAFDLRMAVVEKAVLGRRERARWAADSILSSRNFELIFRESPDAVLVVTARDGLVLEASGAAASVLGLPIHDVRERFLSLLIPGLLGHEELVDGLTDVHDAARLADVPHTLPDGSKRVFEVSLRRCHWSERPAWWVRLDDVTWRRELEEAARREARLDAVRSVSAGAAQALNDALTAVRGNIDLLSKQNTPRTDARDLLESAGSACERAEETVRTLANLARHGHVASRRRSLDLRHFLPRAISMAALRGRITPEFDLAPDLARIEADEAPLKEALLALIENADQAMSGGTIRIVARNLPANPGAPARAAIEFIDAGEGISPAHLTRLFDPYFTTRPGRQGLGLSRALAIIAAHGGTIQVDSVPGQGSTFRVVLPSTPSPGPTAQTAPEATAAQPPKPLRGRILVMDDDSGIRVIVEKMLGMNGFDVYTVRDGQEAIAAYRRAVEMKAPFHVVLLDLDVRGGMGGRECIAYLRGEFPGVRAILTTGYLDDSMLENHREHGFSGVITKPFNVERLVSTVGKLAGT